MKSYVICGYAKGSEEEMAEKLVELGPLLKMSTLGVGQREAPERGETKCGEWLFVGLFCYFSCWRGC